MASAPDIQLARPAGHSALSTPPYLSSSSPFISAILRPAAPPPAQSPPNAQFSSSFNRRGDREGAKAAARTVSDHARLHKRGSRSGSQNKLAQHQSNRRSLGKDVAFSRTYTPPMISEEFGQTSAAPVSSAAGATTGKTSTGATAKSNKIKQNLRKLSQQTRDEPDTTIDLSRTTEENEERSGLAISSPTANSPSLNDTNFARTIRNRQHRRSYSAASAQSSTSGSFKPTEPYVHPMRQATAPQSYANSVASTDLDIFKKPSASTADVSYSSSGVETTDYAPNRPALRINPTATTPSATSAASTNQPQQSANAPRSSKSITTRPRRDTAQSYTSAVTSGTKSPSLSRTSTDRAFSFVRGASRNSPPVDAAARAASIQAARQAFVDREAAKQEKWERKERRKGNRKEEQDEERGKALTVRDVTFAGGMGSEKKANRGVWTWVKRRVGVRRG